MYKQSFLLITSSKKSTIDIISALEIIDTKEFTVEEFNLEISKSSVGVDEIQEIIKWLSLKAEKPKLAILDRAELLTIEAQNKLLKLAEEPYKSTCILLRSNTLNIFLKTLLSRLQIFEFDNNLIKINIDEIINLDFIKREKILEENSKNDINQYVPLFLENFIEKIVKESLFNSKKTTSTIEVVEYFLNLLNKYSKSSNKKIFIGGINIGIENYKKNI